MVTAVQFWVAVTESRLLGTYLPGAGVRDKWLVGTSMDAWHKWSFFYPYSVRPDGASHLSPGPKDNELYSQEPVFVLPRVYRQHLTVVASQVMPTAQCLEAKSVPLESS